MANAVFFELERVSSELISICRYGDTEQKVGKILELLAIIKRIEDKSELIISFDLLKALRCCLVDIDRKLRVQGCRAMRYITCNQMILSSICSLNIPIFMMICLEREDSKYYWERLGALKWIRHLIDNYPLSIPKECVMSLIAISLNGKHEYRRICLDSLRELCIINPLIIQKCNGFKILIDLILNPSLSDISHSLILTMLYILDHPNTRKYLRPTLDIQRLLSPFVSINPYKKIKGAQQKQIIEQRNKTRLIAEKTLMTMLKSITGIFYLGSSTNNNGKNKAILSVLVDLMKLPNNITGIQWARKTIFNVLENTLLPLSNTNKLDGHRGPNLIVNYVCLILMAFIKNGLIECLVDVGMRSDLDLAPRARTLLQRIQFLSAKYLPPKLCSIICSIQRVMNDAAMFDANNNNLDITVKRNFANMMISELTEDAPLDEDGDNAVNIDGDDNQNGDDSDDEDDKNNIYISSQLICHRLGPSFDLNSTFIRYRYMLDRDIPSSMIFQDKIPYHSHQNISSSATNFDEFSFKSQKLNILESLKFDQNASYTENQIIEKLRATQVTQTKDFMLWNMEKVWKVLNGPLWNEQNLNVALSNKTRFIKRLVQYLKPSKQFYCLLKWDISTICHAQCAVQLFRLLTSCDDGLKNQYFTELIEEIFVCLKEQIEINLGQQIPLKNKKPSNRKYLPFSRSSIKYTLCRTYIIMIGILSESQRGMTFFKKHQLFPFLFPLTTKELTVNNGINKNRIVGPNDYLLRLIATNLDYTVDGEFPLLFSQWIAKGSYYLRKTLITHLETLYRAQMPKFDEWSINVLTILLKSEQRLALTALKVLEKINLSQNSIKSQQYLVDLIHTHPTDHVIGEYGQFLFIKMLSTVEGLQFLQENNWLNNKRREWSNLMHTKYTIMIENALVLSVSEEELNDNLNKDKLNDNDNKEDKEDDDDDNDEWLPYHLIYENRSDEEELYAEYLTHFPWSLTITIICGKTARELIIDSDCFFDYNCFYYKNNRDSPISLGAGVSAIILDKFGCSKSVLIDKNDKIRISLNIGNQCLAELYNKKSLNKILSIGDIKHYAECNIIHEDQLYLFFEEEEKEKEKEKEKTEFGLTRIFWSLTDIIQNTQKSLVRPLPHFYGELAKTKEGCTYILSNDEFNIDLQQFILTVHSAYLEMVAMSGADNDNNYKSNNYTLDSKGGLVDNNSNLQLRSCLWALGMIGSSKTGLNLLNSLCNNANDINIIDDICILTKESPTLSIRGTCLYILGLLSRTQSGMNQLNKYGFGFPADNLELDLAVAIPRDITDFFKISQSPLSYIKSSYITNTKISCFSPPNLCRPGNMKPMDPMELMGKQGHTEETILAHISSLCNNVTQKSSASALHRLRSKKPSVFSNPLLFRETLKLLNTYQFKLAAKRFILFTLFDQVILDQDNGSLDLFNESLNDEILPFKQIREWRYNYKQSLIDKEKQKKKQQKQIQPPPPPKPIKAIKKRQSNKLKQDQILKEEDEEYVVIKHHTNNINIKKNVYGPPPVPAAIKNKYAPNTKITPMGINNNNENNNNIIKTTPNPDFMWNEGAMDIPRGRQRSDATNRGKMQRQNISTNPHTMSNKFGNKNNHKFSKPLPPKNKFMRNKNKKNQIQNNQNNQNNENNQNSKPKIRKLSNKKNMGSSIQRRISKLQEKANKNKNFGGNYTGNNGEELADSPTDQMAGPNPLQSDQSINYE